MLMVDCHTVSFKARIAERFDNMQAIRYSYFFFFAFTFIFLKHRYTRTLSYKAFTYHYEKISAITVICSSF